MTKQKRLIYLTSTALLLLCLLSSWRMFYLTSVGGKTDKIMSSTLFYIFPKKEDPFSTHPNDSDYLHNYLIAEQIVGTLLKIGGTGKREPYLADYWQVEDNKKKWKFHLKENLFAEDGTLINAENYVKGIEYLLSWQFKAEKTSSQLPCFSNLS